MLVASSSGTARSPSLASITRDSSLIGSMSLVERRAPRVAHHFLSGRAEEFASSPEKIAVQAAARLVRFLSSHRDDIPRADTTWSTLILALSRRSKTIPHHPSPPRS